MRAHDNMTAPQQQHWSACGFTSAELRARWPWARLQDPAVPADGDAAAGNFAVNRFPEAPDAQWFRSGPEYFPQIRRRMAAVGEWLRAKAVSVPADHTVVVVAHGETNKQVLHALLSGGTPPHTGSHAMFQKLDNTSVSSVVIEATPATAAAPAPAGIARTYCEFVNTTAHLGERRQRVFAQFPPSLGMALTPPPNINSIISPRL
jgi:broad specificity phosphatase PhoE